MNKLEFVQSLIESENAYCDKILEGKMIYNPTFGGHETATSRPCQVVETGEDLKEDFVIKVGQYIVKGWHGKNAEQKNCLKGIQVIEPASNQVYWIRKKSKTVVQIHRFLEQ